MYKYVFALSLVTSMAHANNCNDNSGNTNTNIIIRTVASVGQLEQSPASSNTNDTARSGCCSHHRGVCGCSNGRAVCCDGSYSPSCGCN